MKRKTFLTVLFSLMLPSINCGVYAQIERYLKNESDGFSWYLTYQNDRIGAETISGRTLIPFSRGYYQIDYNSNEGHSYFDVKKNGKHGVCDVNGKEIIATRYDDISFFPYDGHVGYYSVRKNGKEGVCDITGREIIAPSYHLVVFGIDNEFYYINDDGEWFELGYTLDANGRGVRTGTAVATSSTTDNNTSSSDNNSGLLYKGEYTGGAQYYANGQLNSGGFNMTYTIEIYEDYILVNFSRYDRKGTSGGNRIYGDDNLPFGFGGQTTFYVSSSFDIRKVNHTSGQFGNLYMEYPFNKGRSFMIEQGGNDGGYTPTPNPTPTPTPNPVQPHQRTKDCNLCHGSGKCETCNGKHWYYGIGGSVVTCPNCTPNGACSSCGGSGKKTVTEYY